MAIDPRSLRPSMLTRMLNSTPLGYCVSDRQFRRHRNRAGYRMGDDRHVDLFRYVAWLTWLRHDPAPARQPADYEAIKEAARARNADSLVRVSLLHIAQNIVPRRIVSKLSRVGISPGVRPGGIGPRMCGLRIARADRHVLGKHDRACRARVQQQTVGDDRPRRGRCRCTRRSHCDETGVSLRSAFRRKCVPTWRGTRPGS